MLKRESGCCASGSIENSRTRSTSRLRASPALAIRAIPAHGARCASACRPSPAYTSPTNINFLTTLGHSVFLADLEVDAYGENWITGTDEDDNPIWNAEGYLEHTLNFSGRTFDMVLLWAALDYLPEPLVAPVVAHLFESMNPGGQVLAFFHTKMQGEDAVRCRFHLTDGDDVEMQLAQQFPIQRCFTNRSIERLFAGWSGHRQFLAKDSVSEVIMTR
jgi:hypothetical protein